MLSIEKDIVIKRMNGIEEEIRELQNLGKLSFAEFSMGNGFKLAQYHLHRALEGVFNIGAHIISCFGHSQATQYKEIALKIGEYGIVEDKFAKEVLVKMAKYRNRLVHFYAEIKSEELYDIIKNNLNDFNIFLLGIKKVLENPEKFKSGYE